MPVDLTRGAQRRGRPGGVAWLGAAVLVWSAVASGAWWSAWAAWPLSASEVETLRACDEAAAEDVTPNLLRRALWQRVPVRCPTSWWVAVAPPTGSGLWERWLRARMGEEDGATALEAALLSLVMGSPLPPEAQRVLHRAQRAPDLAALGDTVLLSVPSPVPSWMDPALRDRRALLRAVQRDVGGGLDPGLLRRLAWGMSPGADVLTPVLRARMDGLASGRAELPGPRAFGIGRPRGERPPGWQAALDACATPDDTACLLRVADVLDAVEQPESELDGREVAEPGELGPWARAWFGAAWGEDAAAAQDARAWLAVHARWFAGARGAVTPKIAWALEGGAGVDVPLVGSLVAETLPGPAPWQTALSVALLAEVAGEAPRVRAGRAHLTVWVGTTPFQVDGCGQIGPVEAPDTPLSASAVLVAAARERAALLADVRPDASARWAAAAARWGGPALDAPSATTPGARLGRALRGALPVPSAVPQVAVACEASEGR
jgi:hypothetical protein